MKTTTVITYSREEIHDIVRKTLHEEMPALIAKGITKALATPPEDRLIPRREAMDLLGVRSRDTMIKLEKSGDLNPIRIGNRVSYSLANIQEFKQMRA